jgi:hypothetical protein
MHTGAVCFLTSVFQLPGRSKVKKDALRTKTRFTLTLLFAAALLAIPTSSFAAEFFGIIDNFGRKARNAYVDVSVDTAAGPVDVVFDVSSTFGNPLAEFTVSTNSRGFASSESVGNLFDLTGGQPMLVYVRTLSDAAPSAATLHIDSLSAPMTIGLWPTNRRSDGTALSQGQQFGIALGAFRSASVLIANVGGGEQVVDIHVGTRSADGSGIFSNPRLATRATWRVNLTQNEALSNLVVTSTGPIVVQVVIDDGRSIQSFQVLPSQ